MKMRESGAFMACEPKGAIGGCFKIKPWQHMNPYQVEVTTWESGNKSNIGVTDFFDPSVKWMASFHKSTSGARLYAMGSAKAGELGQVFLKVASFLSEHDFDAGTKGLKCKLGDGRVVD